MVTGLDDSDREGGVPMAGRRTVGSKEEEWCRREREEADAFRQDLVAVRSMEGAYRLVFSAPPEGAPGRKFYSNFGFFLKNAFSVPSGAGPWELQLYKEFIVRLDASGELPTGAAATLLDQLDEALQRSPNYW